MVRYVAAIAVALVSLLSFLSGCSNEKQYVLYQGVLTDSTGSPISDGDHTAVLRLYSDSISSSPLWTQECVISSRDGRISALIPAGRLILEKSQGDSSRWLDVQIECDGPKMARTRISLVAPAQSDEASGNKNPPKEQWGSFPYVSVDGLKSGVSILGALVGIFVTAFKLKATVPKPRWYLKQDIEIRNSLKGCKEEYDIVSQYLQNKLSEVYSIKNAEKATSRSRKAVKVVAGLLMMAAGVILTILVNGSDRWSDWWIIGTVYLSIAGVGIMAGMDFKEADESGQRKRLKADNPAAK